MPRYFFDLHDGMHIRDDVGMDLPDVAAAGRAARRDLGEIVAHGKSEESEILIRIDVRDESEATVLVASLVMNVEPVPPGQEGSRGGSGVPTSVEPGAAKR